MFADKTNTIELSQDVTAGDCRHPPSQRANSVVAAVGALDMKLIDDLFEMGGGYVLDFNDRTFSAFFKNELRIDIDDPEIRSKR